VEWNYVYKLVGNNIMKIAYGLILIILIGTSCNLKEYKKKPHFESIEITYYNGWTGGQTVYIDSLGIITKCKYHIISRIESSICCIDTLDSQQIDSLNVMFDSFKNEKIDSIYDGHCVDCGEFYIEIKCKSKTIKSTMIGSNEFENQISRFAEYVTDIMIDKNQIDSLIVFKTTKRMIPPSLDSLVKFRPPETNEE
jgi:hypothetical protein